MRPNPPRPPARSAPAAPSASPASSASSVPPAPSAPPSTWTEPGAPSRRGPCLEAPLENGLGAALPVSLLAEPGAALRLRLHRDLPLPRAPAEAVASVLTRPGAFDGRVVCLRSARSERGALQGVLGLGGWASARALERGPAGWPGGRLAPLRQSRRLNDVGVIVLVVDPDDRVWVARRTRGMSLRGGRWSATASGGVEPGDGPAAGPWTERHLGNAALRELQEETGLRPGAVGAPRLLGLVREWRRGGKPEAVMALRSRRPLPPIVLNPSAEISVLRAIPVEALRRAPRLWAEADLTLRLAFALLLRTRG